MTKVTVVQGLLAFFLGLSLTLIFLSIAKAQQEPAHDYPQMNGHTHDGVVGEFYQTWKRPPYRYMPCCSRTDCRPIIAMRKRADGYGWEIEVSDYGDLKWYGVSDDIWEDNQSDPRESPDGLGHACVWQGRVICAVRSSDQ